MLPNTWLFPYNNIVLMQIHTPFSKEHPVHAVSEHFYFAVNVRQKCWARHERLADSEREHSQLPIRTLDLWKRSYTLLSSVETLRSPPGHHDIPGIFKLFQIRLYIFLIFFPAILRQFQDFFIAVKTLWESNFLWQDLRK